MNSATLPGDVSAATAIPASEPTINTLLRARRRYYERHVLAWYAMGRAQEAHAAWAAVCEVQKGCASEISAGIGQAERFGDRPSASHHQSGSLSTQG
jgi:hypothetical protein